jgi:hypothetical protein
MGVVLSFPFELWRGILFWPKLYYCLYNPSPTRRSIWAIISDPEDKLSTQIKLKNMPSSRMIRPLWSQFLVFSGYQVHAAHAHLHQHTNDKVLDTIANAAGPSLPKVWDPLCLAIPYQYLLVLLFEPPDCYISQWIRIAAIVLVYMIPLCRGAAYLTSLHLFLLPPTAHPRASLHPTCSSCNNG